MKKIMTVMVLTGLIQSLHGQMQELLSNFYFDTHKRCGYVLMMNGNFSEPRLGPPALFYDFEEALLKALRETAAMPCK